MFARLQRPSVLLPFLAGLILFASIAVRAATTATANYLQKYDNGGNLIDSAVYETAGRVGIGTTAPSEALVVEGDNKRLLMHATSAGGNTGIRFQGGAGTLSEIVHDSGNLAFNTDGVIRMRVLNDGNVGVGTSAPGARFEVYGDGQRLLMHAASAGGNTGVRFQGGTGATSEIVHDTGNMAFNTSGTTRLRIMNGDAGGTVSIGAASPNSAYKLHVGAGSSALFDGNVSVGGNIAAKYQDVAEWVDAPEPYAPGTVVVAAHHGARAATRAYDSSVIGVVSERPGVLLGEAGSGRIMVAQSGRVKVKVDASRSSIAVGDLLVTSDLAGHAMKSQPVAIGGISFHRPGTIIGKALEAIKNRRGEILVLVTLQ